MPIPIENNSWDYVQRIIEREINSAFKLKENKMEDNFKTRKLNAADYHKDHPYMKALDKALSHYVATRSLIAQGQYEKFKIDILNSLFHPQAKYDKRVESPNKK